VWAALRAVRRVCNPRTRIFISYYNFVWEPLLTLAEQVGLKAPAQAQNWLGMQDLRNLLALAHLEIIREGTAQLLPVEVPALAPLANRYLAQAPGLRHLALTQFFVCKVASGGGPIGRCPAQFAPFRGQEEGRAVGGEAPQPTTWIAFGSTF
jgi:hypothetical protein